MVAVATGVFLALTAIAAAFQLALAAGVPWGHLTWGGRFPGQLPARMRAAALLSAALLVGVREHADRAATPSRWERVLCALLVALG